MTTPSASNAVIGTFGAATLLVAGAAAASATSAPAPSGHGSPTHRGVVAGRCGGSVRAVNFSDALDKARFHGTKIGGLSSLAWDRRSGTWISAVDNNADDPARVWSFRNLTHPVITKNPLVLKKPNGTPYTGRTADDEGLAVLPDGTYVVSSETEPSIRFFNRDGVQRGSLPVPVRFTVSGKASGGEPTPNATLEGLTASPDGRTIVAAMEGPLSGDVSSSDETEHRFLAYRRHGSSWALTKQIAYRTESGYRVPEVQFSGRDDLLVEEAAWSAEKGNSVKLYAVRGVDRAKDVTRVKDLSNARGLTAPKSLVADLARCPSLGAKAKATEKQANPLLDNVEGMSVQGGADGWYRIGLISDDNFSPKQTTRVLTLVARL